MKRLLVILICFAMLMSLLACGDASTAPSSAPQATNSSTADSTPDSVPTTPSSMVPTTPSSTVPSTTPSSTVPSTTPSSSIQSSGSSGGTDAPSTPTYTPDRTRYEARSQGTGEQAVIYYINEVMKAPTLTPYYNGNKAALTMTFDDGYDVGTGIIVSDIFEKFGFRGTMMLGPCFLGADGIIDRWNKVFARGFLDVGCHGYNHKEPTTLDPSEYEREIKDAIMFLREKFPTQRVLTFATPFAHINSSYKDYLKDYVIGNRLEGNNTNVYLGKDLNFDRYTVNAYSVNKTSTMSKIQSAVEYAVEKGGWMVELYHCVLENAVNSTDISLSSFQYHCDYLYANYHDTIWFATFEEVFIYAEELKHTTVKYTDCDRETMTFKVTPDGTLDKDLYNIPLSVQIYLPQNLVDSAYATVNGEVQYLEYVTENTTGYEYVIVKGLSATEESEVVIHLGGNKTMRNGCVRHTYEVDEIVEPTHDTVGYTVNICTRCEHTYVSEYKNPVHDFSGEVEEMVAPTQYKNGVSKHYCIHCDEYEVKPNYYTEK